MASRYDVPDCMYAKVRGLSVSDAHHLASMACHHARSLAPKGYHAKGSGGGMASRIVPYWGRGFFGVRWVDNYTWFQEHGANPFTMNNLAGKTIPMWIKDPTGKERSKNPKAKTRVTESGITEVLIFRKAAKKGAKKTIRTADGKSRQVPASYPGAPGRISIREAGKPYTRVGKAGGAIAIGNVGVRWRNPGLMGRHFMQEGIAQAASRNGVWIETIVARHPSGQEILVQ